MRKAIVVVVVCVALAWAAVVNGDLSVLGTLTASIVNFTGSTSTAPMKTGTALPASCTIGQAFFKTDATAGQNIYLCTAADTWTQVQGGGGTFDWKPDGRYIALRTDFNQILWNTGSTAQAGDFSFYRKQGTQNLNNPMGPYAGIDRAGFATVSTTTTSGNISLWVTQMGGNPNDNTHGLYYQTNKPWRIEFAFQMPAASDLTNVDAVIGLIASGYENPPMLFGIGVRSSVGPYFYWTPASTSTWETPLSTGVLADSGVWHRVVLRSDGTTNYRMYASLDGGAEVSICTSGCDVAMSDWLSYAWSTHFGVFLRTSAAEQKTITLDYLSFWFDRGGPR